MIKAIIIDDDYISRMLLVEMLKKGMGNVELLGEADCVEEGLLLIN